jgi:DNA end-binding protein Ku
LAPRSIWNGTVAVGEVIIPVKVFSVVQQHRVQFREVRISDGARIRHRRVGSESGEEIPPEQIRKAYERNDGTQVVMTEEEIAAAQGPKNKVIEIEHFTDGAQIDPVFYEKPYLLGAQAGGEHAYAVLRDALLRSGRVGIGRFTLRSREQLVALAPHGEALRLYTMRFADELVDGSDLDLPEISRSPSSKEVQMAERLIEALADEWQPERYEDRHRDAVMAVIEQKAAGGAIEIPEPQAAEPVPDLLAALQQSLERSGKRKPSGPRRKAPTKSPAGSASTRTPARSASTKSTARSASTKSSAKAS